MNLVNDEFFSSQGFLSQGTINEIQKVMENVTPPELPVTRIFKENINNKGLIINIPQTSYAIKSAKERHRVVEFKKSKLIYLPRDARFRVSLKYNKCSSDNFVRIYPKATDPVYKNNPIICCPTHMKKITNVNLDVLEHALGSIIEVFDEEATYELIELAENAVQISILIKFWAPDLNVDLLVKCYNTCHEGFRKSYPKLNFTIEKYLEPKKYMVLCERSIYFKVCASPARDSKSMTLKQRFEPLNILETGTKEDNDILDENPKKNKPRRKNLEMERSIKYSIEEEDFYIGQFFTEIEQSYERVYQNRHKFEFLLRIKSFFFDTELATISTLDIGFKTPSGREKVFHFHGLDT